MIPVTLPVSWVCHDGENNFYLAHLAPNCQEISLRLSGTLPVLHLLELDLWRIEEVPDRSQGTQDTWRDIVILEEHRNYQNNPSSTQFFIQILQFHLIPQTFPMCSVVIAQFVAPGCGGVWEDPEVLAVNHLNWYQLPGLALESRPGASCRLLISQLYCHLVINTALLPGATASRGLDTPDWPGNVSLLLDVTL